MALPKFSQLPGVVGHNLVTHKLAQYDAVTRSRRVVNKRGEVPRLQGEVGNENVRVENDKLFHGVAFASLRR